MDAPRKPTSMISLILANILIPLAVAVFATGFFPYKPFLGGLATFEEAETEELVAGLLTEGNRPRRVFDKVIFMVVDALRSDFVYGNNSGFDFTQSLINTGAAIPFTSHAAPPTVTMPRVKALTTGSVPSFLDLILNFAESDTSSSLAFQDTWLAQIKTHLRSADNSPGNILFYGDDTWQKLFPDFFHRTDGTSSFFVSDFTEVDANVTRHVPRELQQTDWNAMVLHYLGLDHIGHKAGPQSPNMLPKQREMDGIVQTIFAAMELEQHLEDALLVLAGDHGMNSAGNHGGSNPGETSPALVFISPKFQTITCQSQDADTPRRSCASVPHYVAPAAPKSGTEFEYYRQVEQSDLVPTLAALLGLPVPRNNLGVLLTEMLGFWSGEYEGSTLNEVERLLLRNALQMMRILRATYGDAVFDAEVSEAAVKSAGACERRPEGAERLACLWRRVVIELRAPSGGLQQHLLNLVNEGQDTLSTTASSYNVGRLVAGTVIALVATVLALISNARLWQPTTAAIAFTAVSVLYGVMMFATSYVEEEQHFWYWSTGAWMLCLSVKRLRGTSSAKRSILISAVALLTLHRLTTRWNQTGQKYAGAPDIARHLLPSSPPLLWALVIMTYLAIAFLLFRHSFADLCAPELAATTALGLVLTSILFKLNFTWADSPELVGELGSLLREWTEEIDIVHQARATFVGTGMAVVGVCVLVWGRKRWLGESLAINGTPLPKRLHALLTLFLVTQTRVHNIPLFLVFQLQLQCLSHLLTLHLTRPTPASRAAASLPITLTTLLLSYTSYYTLGGSNAISSIDLSSAYNGVSGYNVLAVGTLLFVSNWAGPIWWCSATVLLLLRARDGAPLGEIERAEAEERRRAEDRRRWIAEERARLDEGERDVDGKTGESASARTVSKKPENKEPKSSSLWAEHVSALTVFVAWSLVAVMAACTVLRTHLFIWTVFSPKFLYAMAWSLAWHLIVQVGFGGLLHSLG